VGGLANRWYNHQIVELILEEMEGLGLARKVIKEDKVLWAPTELGLKKIRK